MNHNRKCQGPQNVTIYGGRFPQESYARVIKTTEMVVAQPKNNMFALLEQTGGKALNNPFAITVDARFLVV